MGLGRHGRLARRGGVSGAPDRRSTARGGPRRHMSLAERVVRLEAVSKRFKLYSSARDRLLDLAHVPPARRFRECYALRDVTCDVQRGECLGIIGPNGAGKSTLLKILTGVLQPTSGRLELQGRVLSLLELGSD